MLQDIKTPDAPVSPLYSQAIRANGFVFLSGQVAIDPASKKMIEGGTAEQFQRIYDNIEAILKAASLTLQHIVRVEIYLKDIADYALVNKLYLERMTHHPKPARQALQVSHLPLDALIEISCIAVEKL